MREVTATWPPPTASTTLPQTSVDATTATRSSVAALDASLQPASRVAATIAKAVALPARCSIPISGT